MLPDPARRWNVCHLPVMEVRHYGGGYSKPELAAQLTYSKLLFARKHFGRPRRTALRSALVVRHGLRAGACWLLASSRPSRRGRAARRRGPSPSPSGFTNRRALRGRNGRQPVR